MNDLYKRLFMMLILSSVALGVVNVMTWVTANAAAESKSLDRDLEPVVVKGVQVPGLKNIPLGDLFAYSFIGNTLNGPLPLQIDEMTANGNYTTTLDNILSDNDEIVFMAQDLGDRADDTTVLTGTLPISDTWYEIEITDPLSPTKKGWAYLVRSGTLIPSTVDYVDYDPVSQHITGTHYVLGISSTFAGLEELRLNGGSDILDRTKVRVSAFLGTVTLTEENLGSPQVNLIKDGPVRVILEQEGSGSFAGINADLKSTYLAYGAIIRLDAAANSDITPSSVRISVDLLSTVSGATFYNSNTSGGVTIDGIPETVDPTPFSNWFQVSHSSGRFIQAADPSEVGGSPKNFYRDDDTPEPDDTGQEAGSYGDSGFLVDGSLNKAFTVQSSLFVLPPADENVGATYKNYFFNPLQVTSRQSGVSVQTVFLPLILKNN